MQNIASLEEEVRQLIGEILELDPQQIAPEANLVKDLGMDSMMALEIVAALEKKYKIKLPEAELRNVTTLSRVIDLAKQYVR